MKTPPSKAKAKSMGNIPLPSRGRGRDVSTLGEDLPEEHLSGNHNHEIKKDPAATIVVSGTLTAPAIPKHIRRVKVYFNFLFFFFVCLCSPQNKNKIPPLEIASIQGLGAGEGRWVNGSIRG